MQEKEEEEEEEAEGSGGTRLSGRVAPPPLLPDSAAPAPHRPGQEGLLGFALPLVPVAPRGQEAGDFGGRGWGGDGGVHPQLPVGRLASTQSLGLRGWG